jgi:hypothetical protein
MKSISSIQKMSAWAASLKAFYILANWSPEIKSAGVI